MIIVGAGLAGLIAGHVFPNATIIERSPEPQQAHNALLRFRTEEVGLITGVPFRKVRVHKGVHSEGRFVPMDLRQANLYAMKVVGAPMGRSIWDMASVDRYVAPENFYSRLAAACERRIMWDTDVSNITAVDGSTDTLISTAPLPDMCRLLPTAELPLEWPEFKRAPIFVQRLRLDAGDVHQTVYFTDQDTSTYRASITGDLMIVESMANGSAMPMEARRVAAAFGLSESQLEPLDSVQQSYGKISPIDNRVRKELIHKLTNVANVYSVGRFATWRNILLDDVVQDLRIVKGMIEQNDAYARRIKASS